MEHGMRQTTRHRAPLPVAGAFLALILAGPGSAKEDDAVPTLDSRLRATLQIPVLHERTRALLDIFGELEPGDLPVIWKTFEDLEAHVDVVAAALFAEWWARFDPSTAFERLRMRPFGDLQVGVVTATRTWAQRDPGAVAAALEAITDADRRDLCTKALVLGWMEAGHEGVWEFVTQLPTGFTRQGAISRLSKQMVLRDGPQAALAFADAIPDDASDQFKLQVVRQVGAAIAKTDPELASEWAARHFGEPFSKTLPQMVAVRWVKRDGPQAMGWLTSLPPGTERDRAIQEAYRAWLRHDRSEAMDWMREKPRQTTFEPALSLFAVAVAIQDPRAGLGWVEKIRDPTIRRKTLVTVGWVWLQADREAGLSWLDEADLPSDVRTEILAVLNPAVPGRAGNSR